MLLLRTHRFETRFKHNPPLSIINNNNQKIFKPIIAFRFVDSIMLNTIDYNNHGLLDFNVAFNNGNSISTHSGNPGKPSLFLQHHAAAANPALLQQQQQQHQYMHMQHYQQSHMQHQPQQPHIGQSQLDFANVQVDTFFNINFCTIKKK